MVAGGFSSAARSGDGSRRDARTSSSVVHGGRLIWRVGLGGSPWWSVCRGRPTFYRKCLAMAAGRGWDRACATRTRPDTALRWGDDGLRAGRQSPIMNRHEHHPTENPHRRRQVATFCNRSGIPRTRQAARILGRGEVGPEVASRPALRPEEVRAGGLEEDAGGGLTATGKQRGLLP